MSAVLMNGCAPLNGSWSTGTDQGLFRRKPSPRDGPDPQRQATAANPTAVTPARFSHVSAPAPRACPQYQPEVGATSA